MTTEIDLLIQALKKLTVVVAVLASGLLMAIEPDYDTLIQEAVQQRNSGEFAAAEATLRKAFPLANETNEVAYLLAMVLAFQENFSESTELLDEALAEYPDDIQLMLAKARVLSYQRIYSESVAVATQVLQQQPGNLQARNLLARVYFYQRRYDMARLEYLAVLTVDPDDLDALIGLYDVEIATENNDVAENFLDRADTVSPDHIDVLTRRGRLATPKARNNELIVGVAFSEFDVSEIHEWKDQSVEYRFVSASENQFYVRSEHSRRFGAQDSLLEVGTYLTSIGRLPLEIAVAHTPDNDFLPNKRVRIGTTLNIMDATENLGSSSLELMLTNAEYETGNVKRLNMGFSHYFLNIDGWITPGVGIIEDEFGERTIGWSMGAHWQMSPRLRLGYNYTDAPETENSITTDTTTNHAYARYQLFDASTLRLDISRNDRNNSYTRESISLSLQYRF